MSHCALDSDLSPTVLDFLQSQSQIRLMLRPYFALPSLRRYDGHRVRLEQFLTSILLKREGPLRASYGLLWRPVDDRVHPLGRGAPKGTGVV